MNREILEMALVGYRAKMVELSTKVTAIEIELRGETGQPTLVKKHKRSAESRARMAASQRKRWALARKGKAA